MVCGDVVGDTLQRVEGLPRLDDLHPLRSRLVFGKDALDILRRGKLAPISHRDGLLDTRALPGLQV